MGNLTSRHLQTLKPLSTIQFDLCVTGHDECVTRHALFKGVTFQIISAIMVVHRALAAREKMWLESTTNTLENFWEMSLC